MPPTTTTTTVAPTTTTTTTPGNVPTVSIRDALAIENNKGTTKAMTNICLSAPAPGNVQVSYATADGTATVAAKDYTAKSGTLNFKAGETCKPLNINVKGDTAVEGPETFNVVLTNAVGATIAKGVGVITIIDDDSLLLGLFR